MSKLYKGFLNLTKCNVKEKLVKTKQGETGVWVSIWINDEPDQFGNTMSIHLNQSKEDREAGFKKIYVGNFKPNEATTTAPPQTENDTEPIEKSDLPF